MKNTLQNESVRNEAAARGPLNADDGLQSKQSNRYPKFIHDASKAKRGVGHGDGNIKFMVAETGKQRAVGPQTPSHPHRIQSPP